MLICSTVTAQTGFFIEGGVGGKYINGGMNYYPKSEFTSDFELSRDPIDSFESSVLENSTEFSWKNKLLMNLSGSIGYRYNHKISLLISYKYFRTKPGYYGYYPSQMYPNINTESGVSIQRVSLADEKSDNEKSWYHQVNLRFTTQIHTSKFFFLTGGIELTYIDFVIGNRTVISGLYMLDDSEYSDKTFGIIAGFGIEKPMTQKMTIVGSLLYSFSKYQGYELYYKDLNLDIGGLEIEYSLRYYIK